MSSSRAAEPSAVSRALARDRLGVTAVLAFVLAAVAPLTVAAGLIPTAYAVTGLAGIPAAFIAVAVILAVFSSGYVAMSRHVPNAGASYCLVARGLGAIPGTVAALMALLSYSMLEVSLYGALGPSAASLAADHLGIHARWWVWALSAWAVITVLGLARVEIAGRVLATLTAVEILVITVSIGGGLAHPAGGHLSFSALSPAGLISAGPGTIGVLAVIAVLGCTGFEQGPVLIEESRRPRRTIPAATYTSLAVIAVIYAGSSWAMAARNGTGHVVAAAAAQGPALMFGLAGNGALSAAAQWLFLTSLSAAALAFHGATWRYAYALGREGVLPAAFCRTGPANIPVTASLAQSGIGLAVIAAFAIAGWPPMTGLFFGGGTTGGFGILLLLTLTSAAIVWYFRAHPGGENAWTRLAAPAAAAVILGGLAVLAVMHYGTLVGVPPGSPAAWVLPASYAVIAAIGLAWGLTVKYRRPQVYAAIGYGASAAVPAAVPGRHAP